MFLVFVSRAARVVALTLLLALPWSAHAAAPSASPAAQVGQPAVFGGEAIGSVAIGTNFPVAAVDAPKGEIKPGSSGKPCTAQLGGAIRYADGKLKVCDGASWRVLVMDPAR